MTHHHLILMVALIALAGATALGWWGWQVADAGLLLLGSRLC
jgi:DNA-binding transcriptional regulator of glucitol operon